MTELKMIKMERPKVLKMARRKREKMVLQSVLQLGHQMAL